MIQRWGRKERVRGRGEVMANSYSGIQEESWKRGVTSSIGWPVTLTYMAPSIKLWLVTPEYSHFEHTTRWSTEPRGPHSAEGGWSGSGLPKQLRAHVVVVVLFEGLGRMHTEECLGFTPGSVLPEITPGSQSSWRLLGLPGIQTWSNSCIASALPAELSLWPSYWWMGWESGSSGPCFQLLFSVKRLDVRSPLEDIVGRRRGMLGCISLKEEWGKGLLGNSRQPSPEEL